MSWKRLVYFPGTIKNHVVTEDLIDLVVDDIFKNYGEKPIEVKDCEDLRLDPGGMLCMTTEPELKDFGGKVVSVKPEHIDGSTYRWTRNRELEGGLDSGEKVIKVYTSHFECVCVPESLHLDIGAWLMSISAVGQAARMEIFDALKDVPGIHIGIPEPKAEA
jgi:hypothetical protein